MCSIGYPCLNVHYGGHTDSCKGEVLECLSTVSASLPCDTLVFKQGVHNHERPSMIHVSPRRAHTVREWIGVLASFCLSKKTNLQGVAGSLSPYMEAFSGAWLQASMAATSTHCGFCPWLQLCQRWGREFIDALSYVSQSLSVQKSLQKIY